jgi:hypothetical protein
VFYRDDDVEQITLKNQKELNVMFTF